VVRAAEVYGSMDVGGCVENDQEMPL
jgi:hypothetical protein